MSYTLEFPRRPFPDDIRSSPYVAFAMNNEYVTTSDLPFDIPLAMVLHFAPSTKEWVVQPPADIPQSKKYLLLQKPIVGINIPRKISVPALATIIKRMLQLVGLTIRREVFETNSSTIKEALKVKFAWTILELPQNGLQSLETHLWSRLTFGDPVTLMEIRLLWRSFTRPSPILDEMVQNFIRSYINAQYSLDDGKMIIAWVQEEQERRKFFSVFTQTPNSDFTEDAIGQNSKTQKRNAAAKCGKRRDQILERDRTLNVSPKERGTRQFKDRMEQERRLRRIRSDESIRSVETVIYSPQVAQSASAVPDGQSHR